MHAMPCTAHKPTHHCTVFSDADEAHSVKIVKKTVACFFLHIFTFSKFFLLLILNYINAVYDDDRREKKKRK